MIKIGTRVSIATENTEGLFGVVRDYDPKTRKYCVATYEHGRKWYEKCEIHPCIKNTDFVQRIVVDILDRLWFTDDMKEVFNAIQYTMNKYQIERDPFTGCPCTIKQWAKNTLEYDKQIMDELYGHHDGLGD